MATRTWIAATLAAVLVFGGALTSPAQGLGLFSRARAEGWTQDQLSILASLRLNRLPPSPPDPSNAHEASPAAAALGRRLFFDVRLSRNESVSCASCHDPARHFQDGRPLGQGIATGTRRAMPIVGTGHSPWLFWDGRKDSLWSQALGPLEDAAEHGGNRLRYARLMQEHYRSEYVAVFEHMPDFSRLPMDASPLGTPAERAAWSALDASSREAVSRVFANMGKAIAAYEKSLQHGESRLDRYIGGLLQEPGGSVESLDAQEVRGLRLFVGKAQCIGCHNGPLLSDQHFHNTGVPARDPASPDRGRASALVKVAQDEFNCLGSYSDARPEQCGELRFMAQADARMEGAFKTPGLRNVALRPPYMHAGQFATLEDVVQHYVKAPAAAVGLSELHRPGDPPASHGGDHRGPIQLTPSEQQDLVALLKALSE
ncbi:cytochrome c peroxidase [Piscinibacter sp. XHJ-5]|uniref:cytochrome-c peroxidase n=1 Tax=Piscinibacter sp. XHJ-5 TaxID=3037797 RepID=UPI00245357D5|nr:cytochrome c peroxidase [Piscinibacter sp. XHJ-5]